MNTGSDVVLERLSALHPKVIDLALGRVERLLDRLGNPEQTLPPVIHVAGTNGKGSVIAFLRAFLEAAGLRVHVYTSPHLVRFHERIRLAGTLIDENALLNLLEECEAANDGRPITYFEITTAAAMLAFSRTPADVLLLETGLGGRFDATNVIARPVMTLITPISLDHQSFLGDTLELIAREKAGIIKPGVPCVSAKQNRLAARVIAKRAEQMDAPMSVEGKDWYVVAGRDSFTYRSGETDRVYPLPGLPGKHQAANAGMALAALDLLADRFTVNDEAIRLGLRTVTWPARLQRLRPGPLSCRLPEDWELWVDGGHNPAAAKILSGHARAWRDRPLMAVFGHMANRDPVAFLKLLTGQFQKLVTVAIPGEDSWSAEDLASRVAPMGFDVAAAPSLAAALDQLAAVGGSAPARVLVGGSLYLAGHALRENGEPPR